MESTVEEILDRFRIRQKDLNDVPPPLIHEMFLSLTPKEIFKLCRISRKFNDECKKESLWEFKVRNDYKIDRKLGDTWKETAKMLVKSNMINLDKKWINGMTYRQILNEGLIKGNEAHQYIDKLRKDAIIEETKDDILAIESYSTEFTDIEPTWLDAIQWGTIFVRDRKIGSMDDRRVEKNIKIPIDKHTMDSLKRILTREFSVITAVIYTYSASYIFLPSMVYGEFGTPESPKDLHFIIPNILDFTPYVIQFSLYPVENLNDYVLVDLEDVPSSQTIIDRVSNEKIIPDMTVLDRLGDISPESFLKLSVNELFALCEENKIIKKMCEDESMWRIKVELNYGVIRKYPDRPLILKQESSWKGTAELLFRVDMINLNDKWINEKTYRQILDEAIIHGKNDYYKYITTMRKTEVSKIFDNDRLIHSLGGTVFDEEYFQDEGIEYLDRYLTNNEINLLRKISSREIFIIELTIFTILSNYPLLPTEIRGGDREPRIIPDIYREITDLLDPIPYVIQLCLYEDYDLNAFYG
uniref:F-box domain-containing protein n=1 Tax=Pithovirus LCPAC401 TaxID=2506595 RepID=A0A481ZAY4_9VIRU|nr:MAG: uncharacterized protein LCPAC401_04340 [Pithovirus LCPAC401]